MAAASPRYGLALLADFSLVHFTQVKLNGQALGSYAPNISQFNLTSQSIGSPRLLAAASPLGPAGDSFAVTWHRSH